jgi:hypothetical protein
MRAVVTRTADMRMDLVALTHKGPASARKLTRAHALLQAGVADRTMGGTPPSARYAPPPRHVARAHVGYP